MSSQPIIRTVAEAADNAIPRSPGATMKVLLGADEKMPHFFTRQFTLSPGTHIPNHVHDTIEHQQVMLEGVMDLTINGKVHQVTAGNVMYIPAKASHSYTNVGKGPVRFLCIIPSTLAYTTEFLE